MIVFRPRSATASCLAILSLVLPMLAGCGSSDKPPESGPVAPSTPVTVPANASKNPSGKSVKNIKQLGGQQPTP